MSHVASRFALPKAGNREAEYEDAIVASCVRGRFAIADGASDSSFAHLWARLLAVAFVRGMINGPDLVYQLTPLQAYWRGYVDSRRLPWYAAEKARRGAFAAVTGLAINDDGTWRALAVGDSCVFQIRNQRLVCSFPLETTEEFNITPYLVGSRADRNADLEQAIRHHHGDWRPGDTFLLMSDALAAYFLARVGKHGTTPTAALDFRPRNDQRFARWVSKARSRGELRNDDVSLLMIEVR